MEIKKQIYARNPEQLARAMGLNLSPRKRKGSLAIVAGWIVEASFPKKTSKGWIVSEVRSWKLEVGGKHPTSNIQHPTSTDDLPEQENPADRDFFMELSPEDAERAYRDRLSRNRLIYLGLAPAIKPLAKWEVEELRQNDLIPDLGSERGEGRGEKNVAGGAPALLESDLCDTQADIARKLAAYYSNPDGSSRLQFEIDQQAISDWKKGKRLPAGAPAPPGRCNARQWSLKQWVDWFDRHLWLEWKQVDGGQSEAFGDADLRRMKIQEEREKILHEQFLRAKDRGQYIELTEHHRLADGLGMLINRFISEHCESRLKKSILAGLDDLAVTPDLKQELSDVVGESARRAADGLRSALAEEVRRQKVEVRKPETAG